MATFPMNRGFALFARVLFAATFSTMVLAISGCGHREPFDYVKVQGKVSYEDGSLIPGKRIIVRFISQTPPQDRKFTPRPGDGEVDLKTGMFSCVTSSNTFGNGIVPGEHKVIIVGGGRAVPIEYTKIETTPLTVNASNSPFDLKITKPQ
jgi:hypothetical protein